MNKYHIPNLSKACQVVELICNNPGDLSLKEIHQRLAIPRTTALRITNTLLEANFLAENDHGRLTLGVALVQIGVSALDKLDVRDFARPVLRALSNETGESSHLAVLNGNKSILLEVIDSPHPIRIASRPGTLVDLHCSSTGKIFLAFAVPDPVECCNGLELVAHTKNTNVSVEAVLASIEQTRKDGYALDNEEYLPGVRCIATPVMNALGRTIAAIGITASTSTFTKSKIRSMAGKVQAASNKISANLGYKH